MDFGIVLYCVFEVMEWFSSFRGSFFLCGVIYICIYKFCVVKVRNISIVWYTYV